MAEKLHQKLNRPNGPAPAGSPAAHPQTLNPEIEAKIQQYRKENPKYVEYLAGLDRPRLENIAILRRIEQAEQKQRIQNATVQKLDTWLAQRPDVAAKIAEQVAKVAPEKQAGARINMIRSAIQQEALKGMTPAARQSV